MKKNGFVIAIDGPSGAGKSTVARLLAQHLGYIYIDTGALYRAIGWKVRKEQLEPTDENVLAQLCGRTEVTIKKDNSDPRFYIDGQDVTGEIRTPEMGMMASVVSKSPAVRDRLLTMQRELGKDGGVVMDGRDIGTVVFPDADLKFFLEANTEERGNRRYRELKEKGMDVELDQITREIGERDQHDRGRSISPLKKAGDAFLIDTSSLGIGQVVDSMLSGVEKIK
jgi:cytidylate kinase